MRKLLNKIEEELVEAKRLLQVEVAEFITEAEYDNSDDVLYELPRIYEVSKHGYHIEYAVLRIDNGVVHLGGISEDYGEMKQSTLDELNWDEILTIANQIY
jgi:hypothetical protein